MGRRAGGLQVCSGTIGEPSGQTRIPSYVGRQGVTVLSRRSGSQQLFSGLT